MNFRNFISIFCVLLHLTYLAGCTSKTDQHGTSSPHLSIDQGLLNINSVNNRLVTLCKAGQAVDFAPPPGTDPVYLIENKAGNVQVDDCNKFETQKSYFAFIYDLDEDINNINDIEKAKNFKVDGYVVDPSHRTRIQELCESNTNKLEDYTSLAKIAAFLGVTTVAASYTAESENPEFQAKIDELLKDHTAVMKIEYESVLKSECAIETDIGVEMDFEHAEDEVHLSRIYFYRRGLIGSSMSPMEVSVSGDNFNREAQLISEDLDTLSFTFEITLKDSNDKVTPNL